MSVLDEVASLERAYDDILDLEPIALRNRRAIELHGRMEGLTARLTSLPPTPEVAEAACRLQDVIDDFLARVFHITPNPRKEGHD